jgi:hypothetical protein
MKLKWVPSENVRLTHCHSTISEQSPTSEISKASLHLSLHYHLKSKRWDGIDPLKAGSAEQ